MNQLLPSSMTGPIVISKPKELLLQLVIEPGSIAFLYIFFSLFSTIFSMRFQGNKLIISGLSRYSWRAVRSLETGCTGRNRSALQLVQTIHSSYDLQENFANLFYDFGSRILFAVPVSCVFLRHFVPVFYISPTREECSCVFLHEIYYEPFDALFLYSV